MNHKNCVSTVLLVFTSLLLALPITAANKQKPNIVIIMTDQQFADAMSCVKGKTYIHMPNMDKLSEKGVRFTRAYSPNPLCLPMRTSMMTGRYPHETGILTNDDKNLDASETNDKMALKMLNNL